MDLTSHFVNAASFCNPPSAWPASLPPPPRIHFPLPLLDNLWRSFGTWCGGGGALSLRQSPLIFSPAQQSASPPPRRAAFAVFYCKIWVGLFMEGIFSLQAPLMTLLQRIIRHATLLSSYGLALSSLADCQSGVRLWLSTLASRLERE